MRSSTFLQVVDQINMPRLTKYNLHVRHVLQQHYKDQSRNLYVMLVGHNADAQLQYSHQHLGKSLHLLKQRDMLHLLVHIAVQFQRD